MISSHSRRLSLRIFIFLAVAFISEVIANTYVSYTQVTTIAGDGSSATFDNIGTSAAFDSPNGIAIDPAGTSLYVVQQVTSNEAVRKIDISSGSVTTILKGRTWNIPTGIACDAQGLVYISDTANNCIVRGDSSDTDGTGTQIAGSTYGFVNDITGSSSKFHNPAQIYFDPSTSFLYIADTQNSVIRRMSSTYPYPVISFANIDQPHSVAVDNTRIYATMDPSASDSIIYYATISSYSGSALTMSPYAGSGGSGLVDGSLLSAQFYYINYLAVDSQSNLYIADASTLRIAYKDDTVETLAGSFPTEGFEDGAGETAFFQGIWGVTFLMNDATTLYVTDTRGVQMGFYNNRIRKITCASGYLLVYGSCGKIVLPLLMIHE